MRSEEERGGMDTQKELTEGLAGGRRTVGWIARIGGVGRGFASRSSRNEDESYSMQEGLRSAETKIIRRTLQQHIHALRWRR